MSNGQTGPGYGQEVPSPMFRLPKGDYKRAPALKAGCAGCAAGYGQTYRNNDYGRVYNYKDAGFQGPVYGNGVFGSCGSRACASAPYETSKGCGSDYTHPAAREHLGRIGCKAPECSSNAEAVDQIYARQDGKYTGCGVNPLGDRLLEHKYVNAVSNFSNSAARERYVQVVKEFGEPNWIANQPGGEAVWNNRAFYSRISLSDAADNQMLTATVGGIRLPKVGIQELLDLSPLIQYNEMKQELSASGNAMPSVVASLLVAIDTALDDDLTLEEARLALPKMISDGMSQADSYVEMARALEEDVREAHASS